VLVQAAMDPSCQTCLQNMSDEGKIKGAKRAVRPDFRAVDRLMRRRSGEAPQLDDQVPENYRKKKSASWTSVKRLRAESDPSPLPIWLPLVLHLRDPARIGPSRQIPRF